MTGNAFQKPAVNSSRSPLPDYQVGRRTAVLMGLAAFGTVTVASQLKAQAATPAAIRINSGGPAVTTGGVVWSADQYFSGGKAFTNPAVSSIAGTTDDVLYLTERSATSNLGSFNYSIPVPAAGSYTVNLYFAEIWFGAPGGGPGGAGKRVFSANLQGGAVELANYDLFASVGAVAAAAKTFTVDVNNFVIDIAFSAAADQPKVSAIEVVFPTGTVTPPPAGGATLRINAGGPALVSGGVSWLADQYFTGGKAFTNSAATAIAGTTDDVLYTTERSATADGGSFGYAVPVTAAGAYTVRLHFAEIWFGAAGGGPGGAGKRIFSANLEGGAVELANYDIFADVGAASAAVKEFTVNVTNGVLNLDFTATVNQPKVSAIEITYPAGAPLPVPANTPWPASWAAGKSSPVACFEAAGLALGGIIYRFGGFDSSFRAIRSYSSFNPATNTWTTLGSLPAGMAETHLGITEDGRYIYFGGGFAGNLDTTKTPTQTVSDRVYRYDPSTNSFALLTRLPAGRGAGAFAALNGELHYISGNPADRVTNVGDHFVYNLTTTRWTAAAPLPNPKDHMSCVVLGGKIYVVGGEHGHDKLHLQQGDGHAYNPVTNSWTQISSLPMSKSHIEAGTFVADGKIIMAGGQMDNFQPTSQVVAYDPVGNNWSVLPSLPVARQGAIVQRVGTKVILAVGGAQTNQPQTGVWLGTVQ
ncbi:MULTISPECIES: malectin domain-containing carbohydrate-binding protein [unclassified Arthrobacter]|uniref:malectin domain-containing carbohydrate-binding protein n=1 Tax=unclassified Arthrobacter TaxID=235627 RepID=UPI001CFFE5FD|nr:MULTISPECIES: malectin domain-containing carbohydrate-binding protein [unclassified Arthrobacter]MCB5280981.1 N-acetylneuraminate epimerase [Arthrobacter sp. ES1]WGZ80279.1 malectin domain-containing carbohydrate-binding protein [Arthrobacter sp. EM1]